MPWLEFTFCCIRLRFFASDASPKDGGKYVCTSAEDETDVLEVVIDGE